jgi:putative transferase (TIGR04331 family)
MSRRYHLVLTAADFPSFSSEALLLLGWWCIPYKDRCSHREGDFVVALPYGVTEQEKMHDSLWADCYTRKVFPRFSAALNQVHHLNFNEREWSVLTGHWFSRTVSLLYNRIRTLQQCIRRYPIKSVSVGSYDDSMVPQDSLSSIWLSSNPWWNNVLYGILFERLQLKSGIRVSVSQSITKRPRPNRHSTFQKVVFRLKRILANLINKLQSLLAKSSKAFIINTYLPADLEVQLQLKVNGMPFRWFNSDDVKRGVISKQLRAELRARISMNDLDHYERVLTELLVDLMPTTYLESFNYLNERLDRTPWPKSPKYVFTSNNFDTDELFKLYVARVLKRGGSYYVGQHGNYGHHRFHCNPSVEELTADKFFTWGWSASIPSHNPTFLFKNPSHRAGLYQPGGGALLIELHAPHQLATWDEVYEHEVYSDDQREFYLQLHETIQKTITVRLHSGHVHTDWSDIQRWQDIDPEVKIDDGHGSLAHLIEKSRVVVHSYDSTGLIETLAQNIPTVAFWQNGLLHVRPHIKPLYEELLLVGVIHTTAKSAADFLNQHWNDIDLWWKSTAVQAAREKFCSKLGRQTEDPLRCLLKHFS